MILVFVIVYGMGYLYIDIMGYPSKIKATRPRAEKYIEERYPKLDIDDLKTWYDCKLCAYGATVTTKEKNPITFYIEFYNTGYESDNYIEEKLKPQIEESILNMLKNKNYKITDIDTYIHVEDDVQLSEETEFNKDLPIKISLWIDWKDKNITKEQFIKKSLDIKSIIDNEGISVDSYSFDCQYNKEKSYRLWLDEENMDKSMEELIISS